MSKLFWLASYPKSGNTWLRALLTNYLSNDDKPADINNLLSAGAFSQETLDEYLGIDTSELTIDQIFNYRPLVYNEMSKESSEAFFLKVHDAYIRNVQNNPIFPKQSTAGVFYLIRNPLEVAVSYAHHLNKSIDSTITLMGDEEHFLGGWKGNHGQLPQKLLSWTGHVNSWTNEPGLNLKIVRYEDMLKDTIGTFTKIVKFANLDIDKVRINKAVEHSSFDKLKQQEQDSGFSEKQPSSESFFRKGKPDSWRTTLTNEQIKRIVSDHGEAMEEFGYLNGLDRSFLE